MHVEISNDNTINGTADLSAALTGTIRHSLAHFEARVTRVASETVEKATKEAAGKMKALLETKLDKQFERR